MAAVVRHVVRLGKQRGVLWELEYIAMVRQTMSEVMMDTVLSELVLSLLFGDKPPAHCIKRAMAVFAYITYNQFVRGLRCSRVQIWELRPAAVMREESRAATVLWNGGHRAQFCGVALGSS